MPHRFLVITRILHYCHQINSCILIKNKLLINDINNARWMYNTYKTMCCNWKKRKYVDGAIYTEVFSEAAHIIDVPDNEIVELKILTAQKKVSILSIYFERKSDLQHLKNCCKLGQILSNYKGNTFRKKCFDDDEMYIVGQGKVGNGSTGSYKMTKYPGVENA